jgi:hypothetical protein
VDPRKNRTALCILLILGTLDGEFKAPVSGQEVSRPERVRISIPTGGPVAVDGTVDAEEWEDADSVLLLSWSADPVKVFFKHDGSALLLAFSGFDEARPLVPEVLIATEGHEDTVWGPGHWWFHASGRDCWANGRYNDWGTCVPVTPAWEASNPPRTERWPGPLAWEMRIPFSTVGVDPASGRGFGIAFDLTDTERFWFLWPSGAQLGIPATWAEAVLEVGPSRTKRPGGSLGAGEIVA